MCYWMTETLLSLQTCNTWSDSCGSHLACSGVNSQVSPTPDEVIIWQAVAATESTRPQWGTGHPTFPPITHPLPFSPPPHFPAYHPRRQAGSQITFFHILLRNLSFCLEQKYAIFRSNSLTLLQLQSVCVLIIGRAIRNGISGNTICKTCFCHSVS